MLNISLKPFPVFCLKKLLCFAFFLGSASLYAWDGTSVAPPALTDRTYKISTPEELAWVARQSVSTDFDGYTFELQCSIDLGENCNWTPIGSTAMPFQGTFKGNCHAIANININYTTSVKDIGLFGYIGTNGSVQELAVKSGKIYLDKKSYIGCIAGQNHGNISYCFNLGQIVADESDYVGGLTGYNTGRIDHCYNAGIISAAQNFAGGLTGNNDGAVSNCYNIGYTKASGNCGAITGGNGAQGTFSNVYYDLQMCLLNAAPVAVSGITTVNTTLNMFSLFASDAAYTGGAQNYPQLTCFAQSEEQSLSLVSVVPLLLDINVPMQRAESVSKDFSLSMMHNISWFSPNPDLIEVVFTTGKVHHPCQKQEIILQAVLGDNVKKVYLQVEGYDIFDAGEIGGVRKICLNDKVLFSNRSMGGESKPASGGKNDDAKNKPYFYKLLLYELLPADTEGQTDTVFLQEIIRDQQSYAQYFCYSERAGTFLYKRYAHDSQCHTDWAASAGEMRYEVMEGFDAGEISSTTDTIYGSLPRDTAIVSIADASGGIGPYKYRWYLTQQKVDYVTGDITAVSTDLLVQTGREPVDTSSYRPQLTAPGEYFFSRTASDSFCYSEGFADSQGIKHFVVFDTLCAGTVRSGGKETCDILLSDTIEQEAPPTGGNGRYSYRWLCNGEVVQGADSAFLSLKDVVFQHGQTFLLQREVKDDTGLMDWTLSEGGFTVVIYAEFDAGSIRTVTDTLCLTTGTERITIAATETMPPQGGEGQTAYRWKFAGLADGQKDSLDTFDYNLPSLSYRFRLEDYAGLSLPATVVLTREVRNLLCSDDWIPSAGEAVLVIGQESQRMENITLCRSDLPYTASYIYTDGTEQSYTLKEAGDTVLFHDKSAIGCREKVTLRCKVVETPEVELEPMGTVCQNDSLLTLHFRITKGNPDSYAVTYSPEALQAGFKPVEGVLVSRTELSVPVPKAPMTDYEMYILFFAENGEMLCQSRTYTVPFSMNLPGYVYDKWNDVLYVDNNDKNGVPNAETDLKFVAYQWYKDGEAVPGATEQVYQEDGGLNGIYYVLLTDSEGNVYRSCEVERRPTSLENVGTGSFAIAPVPLPAGTDLYVSATEEGWCEVFNSAGASIGRRRIKKGTQSLTLPAEGGIFLLRFVRDSGLIVVHKLIVK